MKILNQNGVYNIISNFKIEDKFETKYYELGWDLKGNVFLKDASPLTLPAKLYDPNKKYRKMFLNSFEKGEKNLGILLTGEKGTGKTMDAKMLCKASKLPVFMITNQIPKNVDFVSFFNTIEQNFVIYIDEFEKLFSKENTYGGEKSEYHGQASFLSFMSGLDNKYKKMFILTTNKEVEDLMMNRPSRIKWIVPYKGLSAELAKEIIMDKLVNKAYMEDLLKNINREECTMDILISIIDEINNNDMPYSEFKNIFNFKEELFNYELFVSRQSNDGEGPESANELLNDFKYINTETNKSNIIRMTSGSNISVMLTPPAAKKTLVSTCYFEYDEVKNVYYASTTVAEEGKRVSYDLEFRPVKRFATYVF